MTPETMQRALTRRSHQTQAMSLVMVREQHALGVLPRPVQVREAIWQHAL